MVLMMAKRTPFGVWADEDFVEKSILLFEKMMICFTALEKIYFFNKII